MNRFPQLAAALLLGLIPAWSDQATKEPPKPPVKAPGVRPAVPKGAASKNGAGGGPKAGFRQVPVIRPIPGPQVQRFLRLTPQEREIAIDKMPIASQQRMRQAAERWDALPADERNRQLKLFDSLSSLPKDKQELVNQRIGEFQQLGPERKLAVRRVYQLLSGKTEEQRRALIDSAEFKERFTPREQQIVVDLVKYYPNPDM